MPTMWLSDSQKIGVAFCSGGGFFLIGGVLMFFDRAMLAMGNVRIHNDPESALRLTIDAPPDPFPDRFNYYNRTSKDDAILCAKAET
ncbi:Got1 family protein [Rutstroemia sp. NJR-2017a BVV2]|nr:Got1 family protein [Rutstroemia sp. NJR-2017a BVV2]